MPFLLRLAVITSSILLLLPQHGAGIAVPQMGGGSGASSSAAPTPTPFPDKQTIDQTLVQGQPPPNKAAFMTNLVARTQLLGASQYAEANGLQHDLNPAVWNKPNFTDTGNYTGSQEDMTQFVINYSQTFASAAAGTSEEVYVLIGKNKSARANCTFYQTEFPALKAGGTLNKIIRADYSPGMMTSTPINQTTSVWWTKGQPDPPPDPLSIHSAPPVCSSNQYPQANHCELNQAVDNLSGSPTSQFCVDPGAEERASCVGGTGILVQNKQKTQLCIDNENLALSVDELQQSCDAFYDSSVVNCGKEPVPALTQDYDIGFTLKVVGGQTGCAALSGPTLDGSGQSLGKR